MVPAVVCRKIFSTVVLLLALLHLSSWAHIAGGGEGTGTLLSCHHHSSFYFLVFESSF
jgi:hypothetical protein